MEGERVAQLREPADTRTHTQNKKQNPQKTAAEPVECLEIQGGLLWGEGWVVVAKRRNVA